MKGSVTKSKSNPEVPTETRSNKGVKMTPDVITRIRKTFMKSNLGKTVSTQSKPQTGVHSIEPLGLRTPPILSKYFSQRFIVTA